MIYDCFLFFNELEVLDLRLRVLDSVVDHFVLVESTTTFTGKPKELLFEKNKDRFAKWLPKITHVVVEDSPNPTSASDAWNVEHFQRNAIERGLIDAPAASRIMVSDVDEIPNPWSVTYYGDMGGVVGFPMSLYYYYVNCQQVQIWWGTVMASKNDMGPPQYLRNRRNNCSIQSSKLGWHFSFLGDVTRIQEKLGAYSETQTNTTTISSADHIQHCLDTGADLFSRPDEWAQKKFVQLDDTYPTCIHDWLKDHPQYYHA
jgi:beta-1,4-mannosyl-glycoprotein beta-1,4-N-acetylglucosaminyltransferase